MLSKFVDASKILYSIAFTQWRIQFPSKVRWEEDQLEEILHKSQSVLSTFYWMDNTRFPRKLPSLPPEFFKIYANGGKAQENKPFLINSLGLIEWPDPFEDDSKDKSQIIEDKSH